MQFGGSGKWCSGKDCSWLVTDDSIESSSLTSAPDCRNVSHKNSLHTTTLKRTLKISHSWVQTIFQPDAKTKRSDFISWNGHKFARFTQSHGVQAQLRLKTAAAKRTNEIRESKDVYYNGWKNEIDSASLRIAWIIRPRKRQTFATAGQESLRTVSIPLASNTGSFCSRVSYMYPTYRFFVCRTHGRYTWKYILKNAWVIYHTTAEEWNILFTTV